LDRLGCVEEAEGSDGTGGCQHCFRYYTIVPSSVLSESFSVMTLLSVCVLESGIS